MDQGLSTIGVECSQLPSVILTLVECGVQWKGRHEKISGEEWKNNARPGRTSDKALRSQRQIEPCELGESLQF